MTSSSSASSFIVFLSAALIMAAGPSIQDHEIVRITNQLSKALIAHCRSADTDLSAHVVSIGSDLAWSFDDDIFFGKTLFWCHLAVGEKRLLFTAYEDKGRYPGTTQWLVNDTGVYLPGDGITIAYLW